MTIIGSVPGTRYTPVLYPVGTCTGTYPYVGTEYGVLYGTRIRSMGEEIPLLLPVQYQGTLVQYRKNHTLVLGVQGSRPTAPRKNWRDRWPLRTAPPCLSRGRRRRPS